MAAVVERCADRPAARGYVLTLTCAALGFLAITLAVARGWLLPADEAVLGWVAARRDCGSIGLATALSFVGAGEVSLLLTALLAGACLARRQPRAAAALLLLYLSVPVELVLKLTLAQPLPSVLFPIPGACEWYHPTLSVLTPHSYPSGYAIRVTYFFLLVAAWLLRRYPARRGGNRRALLPALPIALILAALLTLLLASRLVLSWHWPSDLLGGALLGSVLAVATLLAAQPSAFAPPLSASPSRRRR